MKFAILMNSAPFTYQASDTAYQFCIAALAQGHQIQRAFIYHDEVYTASALTAPPQDEIPITQRWQALAAEHNVELVVCVAAALRRGILDEPEAARYGKPAANLANGFNIAGLGQLVEASLTADRFLVFGG